MITIAEYHARVDAYWAIRNAAMAIKLEDRGLVIATYELLKADLEERKTFGGRTRNYDEFMDVAERICRRTRSEDARKGGKARKADALGVLIRGIVAENSAISECHLLDKLRRMEGDGVIYEVDETTIHFNNSDGSLKKAPISGLKDRLTRAKVLRKKA